MKKDIETIIKDLKEYGSELEAILGRFTRDRNGIHIARDDAPRFEQITRELRDFFDDLLGENKYSEEVVWAYSEGIDNFTRSPSFKSVERVKGIVTAAITRIERNPELLNKTSDSEMVLLSNQESFFLPDKVTLRWLVNNVPYKFWLWLGSLLLASFIFGITATTKLTIIQEWVGIECKKITDESKQ